MACQTIFNRHVGVKQADHGQLAETALTILRLVDFLKYFQGSETYKQKRITCSYSVIDDTHKTAHTNKHTKQSSVQI